MKDRLIQFLAYLEIGQTRFEEKVGMSRGHINNMGETITSKTLSKIKLAYPELNEIWLLTGEGEMLKSTTQEAKGNNSLNNNINGNIEGNITISHNEMSSILEIQRELNAIIKTTQSQLTESQKQVSDLIEILKNK